jgi:GH15 family glucan-1,4-alpha-glucosidase
MPRDIVLGNGEILINLDKHLSIRDIYYPYVGWANHVGGHYCRLGVWAEGAGFRWLDDSWDWQIRYENDTLVTQCSARHHGLGVRLRFAHAVLPDKNIYVQRIAVENFLRHPREIRIFFGHDLRIDESDIGDTAYYTPFLDALIHYKRNRYFLMSGYTSAGAGDGDRADGSGIWQYACGQKASRGAEGTWRDAEDGSLSMNAIAQGAVDSVVGYSCIVDAESECVLRTWMTIGADMDEVTRLQAELLHEGVDAAIARTREHWREFMDRRPRGLSQLPDRVADLFARSLLVIRTQIDNRGAVLASNDSDIMETARAHYSYVWPRDGALIAASLDEIGYPEISRPFFEFCSRVLEQDRGALMHKYGPDGTLGASWHPWVAPDGSGELPFQEDGTALVVWALYHHCKLHKDPAFAESMYERLIRPCSDFMVSYRDPHLRLPLSSWDIWEERRGTHIFSTSAVCAALVAAADFAQMLDHNADAQRYRVAAEEVRQALAEHFWDAEAGYFSRTLTIDAHGEVHRDSTADSSAYAVFAFGVLPTDHPKVIATMQALGRKLWVRAGMGGMARYERDYYFHVTTDFDRVPGNPWIICTLWLAEWHIASAKSEAEMRGALDLLEWVAICALRTGVLSEQVHPYTLQPLSVAPLTWSHGQFIHATMAYLKKLEELRAKEPASSAP